MLMSSVDLAIHMIQSNRFGYFLICRHDTVELIQVMAEDLSKIFTLESESKEIKIASAGLMLTQCDTIDRIGTITSQLCHA